MKKRDSSINKTVVFLNRLYLQDYESLILFLSSPYFNTNKTLVKFIKYYRRLSNKDKETLTIEQIRKGLKLTEKTVRNALSDLGPLLFEFMGYEEYRRKTSRNKQDVIDYCDNKKKFDLAEPIIEEMLEEIVTDKSINSLALESYYNYHFLLSKIRFERANENKYDPNSLLEVTEHLSQFYDAQLLYLGNEYKRLKNSENNHIPNFEYVLDKIEKDSNPTIKGYALVNKIDHNEDEDSFFLLRNLWKSESNMKRVDMDNFFYALINFCTKMKEGQPKKYIKITFEIIKHADEIGLIYEENGVINLDLFSIAVKASIVSSKVNWAQDFLNRYEEKLYGMKKDFVVRYTQQEINFANNKIEPCIEELLQLHPLGHLENIQHLRLLLKATYLSSDNYHTDLFFESHRKILRYIRENELSKVAKYKAAIIFSKTMFQLKKSRHEKAKFKSILDSAKADNVLDYEWIASLSL